MVAAGLCVFVFEQVLVAQSMSARALETTKREEVETKAFNKVAN